MANTPVTRTQRLWNSLEIAKLITAILTPVLLFWLVTLADQSIRGAQEIDTRRTAIKQFSELLNARLTRAALLRSVLNRHGTTGADDRIEAEMVARKALYDQAYFDWNVQLHANLLLIRHILDEDAYTRIEQLIETRLVTSMLAPLDAALTAAYDRVSKGSPHPEDLLAESKRHIDNGRACSHRMIEELYRLSVGADGSGHSLEEAARAIEEVCVLVRSISSASP